MGGSMGVESTEVSVSYCFVQKRSLAHNDATFVPEVWFHFSILYLVQRTHCGCGGHNNNSASNCEEQQDENVGGVQSQELTQLHCVHGARLFHRSRGGSSCRTAPS